MKLSKAALMSLAAFSCAAFAAGPKPLPADGVYLATFKASGPTGGVAGFHSCYLVDSDEVSRTFTIQLDDQSAICRPSMKQTISGSTETGDFACISPYVAGSETTFNLFGRFGATSITIEGSTTYLTDGAGVTLSGRDFYGVKQAKLDTKGVCL